MSRNVQMSHSMPTNSLSLNYIQSNNSPELARHRRSEGTYEKRNSMVMSNIQMPEKVQLDEGSFSNTFGRFIVQPLEKGFGVTIGNAFRRVLLSSISGTAFTAVRIEGVLHEFSTIN